MDESALAEYLAGARPDVAPIVAARDAAPCVCTRSIFHLRVNTWLCVLLVVVLFAGGCSSDAANGERPKEAAPGGTTAMQATATTQPTGTTAPVAPTPVNTAQAAVAPDLTATLPPPTLSAEAAEALARLTPEDLVAVQYADWLETVTDHWATDVMVPATQQLSAALRRTDYDAFCQVAVADAAPLQAELAAHPAPAPLKDAYGYATVILQHWQSYRNGLESFCQSRDTQDLAPAGQALSQAGAAYQSLRAALQMFYAELSIRIGLTPAPGGSPGLPAIVTPIAQQRPTADPDAVPTMSPETRTIFLRSGADRLDREMGEWMALIANPRLTELRKHLDRGDFGAACQVTLVDVSFMLLGMTSPIAGLEDLRPAHDAARRTLTTWQDLRETMQAFCRAPEAEGVATVIAGLDSVAASFQRFQSELKRLQQTTAEPAPTALVGMPNESSGLIQADGESLEDFLARIAVAESAYWPPEALLVYSVVNDARNLRRGVSVRPADARRCWVHQEQSLTPCQGQDVQESLSAHRDSSAPTVYFAIAASDAAEMLVMHDVHDPREPGDTVDGYRVVLRHRDGRWHEESLQWTY